MYFQATNPTIPNPTPALVSPSVALSGFTFHGEPHLVVEHAEERAKMEAERAQYEYKMEQMEQ